MTPSPDAERQRLEGLRLSDEEWDAIDTAISASLRPLPNSQGGYECEHCRERFSVIHPANDCEVSMAGLAFPRLRRFVSALLAAPPDPAPTLTRDLTITRPRFVEILGAYVIDPTAVHALACELYDAGRASVERAPDPAPGLREATGKGYYCDRHDVDVDGPRACSMCATEDAEEIAALIRRAEDAEATVAQLIDQRAAIQDERTRAVQWASEAAVREQEAQGARTAAQTLADEWFGYAQRCVAQITDLHARLGAAETDLAERTMWRPIETAPTNGTRILLHGPRGSNCNPYIGLWSFVRKSWVTSPNEYTTAPTHWQPLPAPPSGS